MPYIKCVKCNNLVHVNVDDIFEWTDIMHLRHPTWDGEGPVPEICAKCWVEEKGKKEAASTPK